jgi:hypothetical protein
MNESERQHKIRNELVREKEQEKFKDPMGDGVMIKAIVVAYHDSDLLGKLIWLSSISITLYIFYMFSDWFLWIINIGR